MGIIPDNNLSDHTDSPHGYVKLTMIIENHPDIDAWSIADELIDYVYDILHDADDNCAVEHYEYGSTVKCMFHPDPDYNNVEHKEQ